MSKGRVSVKVQLEQHFKKPIQDILKKHFKGIQTDAEAVQKISEITKGAIKTSHITLCKIVYEAISAKLVDLKDYPFAQIEEKQSIGHRGKRSVREILEEKHKKSIWDILKPFKTLSPEEIAMKFDMGIPTLLKTIQKGIDNNEITQDDFPFIKKIVKEHSGHKGKKSIREILEKDHGKSFWELLKPYEKYSKEEAARNLGIKLPSLINSIQRAIELKEIPEDSYSNWIKRKQNKINKKNKNNQTSTIDLEDKIPVKAVCTECGHSLGWYTRFSMCGSDLMLALKGRKCPKCGNWGTFKASVKIGDRFISKQVLGIEGISIEEFVNDNSKVILNPLTDLEIKILQTIKSKELTDTELQTNELKSI